LQISFQQHIFAANVLINKNSFRILCSIQ